MPDFSEISTCSSKSELALRPDFGVSGFKIEVISNFFPFKKFKDGTVFLYDFKILPEKSRSVNWKIFKHMESEYKDTLFDNNFLVYDGGKLVISPAELKFGDEVTIDVNIDQRRPESDGFKVTLKKINELDFGILNSEIKNSPNPNVLIMITDLILKHKLSKESKSIGNSFYFPQNSFRMSGGIEAWSGIYHTCKLSSQNVLVNINNSTTTFFSSINLDAYASNLFGLRNISELPNKLSDAQNKLLLKNIRGLIVFTSHRGEKEVKFKVEGLTQKGSDQEFFKLVETEENTDVYSYFQKKYNIRLNRPSWPCIISRKNTKIPLELCKILPGQRYTKELNEKQRQDIIKFTCQDPKTKRNKIQNAAVKLNFKENEYLKAFGMEVGDDMQSIPARILNAPKISYDVNTRDGSFVPNMGVWNLRNKKFYIGAILKSWGVIFFGGKDDVKFSSIRMFKDEIIKTCNETGIKVELKTPFIENINPMSNMESSMKDCFMKIGNDAKLRPQLLLCILNSPSSLIYSEIKRISETILGVPTQCVQAMKALKANNKQYCANVCLKMNAKLGGINMCLLKDQMPFIHENGTIIFGASLTKSLNKRNPSIASVVNTLNPLSVTYHSSYRQQDHKVNFINDLEIMIREALISFYNDCEMQPSTIFFYRDGVSEGEFPTVLENEVLQIKSACKSLGESYNPLLTYIVSQKRHNVIFIPVDGKDADRSGNCVPGTVIDSSITHPLNFDFYINSHSGIKGTSKSTHYFVLYDENELSSDIVQKITYNLCYTFLRCTRAVSVVPPLYYANLLSKRTMCYAKNTGFSDTESESSYNRSDSGIEVHKYMKEIMYYV